MIDGPTTPGAARHARRAADPYPMAFVGLTDWDWLGRLGPLTELDEGRFCAPGPPHPSLRLLVFLILPGSFVLGLLLMPLGIGLRRRSLREGGELPAVFPA